MVEAKLHQNAQIFMLQFKIYPGAMPPNPHVGGGATVLIPKLHPLGTPALRASWASLGA